jgi:hypothetical protein
MVVLDNATAYLETRIGPFVVRTEASGLGYLTVIEGGVLAGARRDSSDPTSAIETHEKMIDEAVSSLEPSDCE